MGQTELAPKVPTSAPAAEELPAIELLGVNKEFPSQTTSVVAVEDVDLQVGAGEFFSLLGPSGCGKTTTLSPTSSVGSIDREGMKNACTRKPLTSTASTNATSTSTGSSADSRACRRRTCRP